jgi:hypothetical protein
MAVSSIREEGVNDMIIVEINRTYTSEYVLSQGALTGSGNPDQEN